MENFCREIAGREEIWYATNMEIYEYVTAFRSLSRSTDGSIVYNPTVTKVWFDRDGALFSVAPGETVVCD